MYLSFYGLKRKPFQISTDPSFLWLGEKHKEALAILKYGILENQGFLLLTGDVGTGKTTLINALINSLGDEVIVAKVPDPGMETIDFMNYISHTFDMKKRFVSKDAFLIHFGHFLNSAYAAGKKVLLIIDESQRLSSDLLEEIRQLSNIEKQETKLLNIFFIGQNEFNDVLLENKNRALRQRITINYAIDPLDVHETGEFVRHRLKIAGAEKDIFSPDAIRSVYEFSVGFPRRINIICDHSLLSGFVQGKKTVTANMVRECAKDLSLPDSSKNKDTASLESVDSDSGRLKDIPPERLQEIGSSHGWRTVGTVVLVAMAVFIITYIKYPKEYRDLFYRVNINGLQVFSGQRGTNAPILNSYSEPYKEPNKETASSQDLDAISKMLVSDEGAKEVSVARELLVENVEPAGVVSKDHNTDVLLEGPTGSSRPDDVADSYPTPPPDQQNIIIDDVTKNSRVISNTEAMQVSESGVSHEEEQKVETITGLESPPLFSETLDAEVKTSGMTDTFAINTLGDPPNQQNKIIEEQVQNIPVFSESAVLLKSATGSADEETEKIETIAIPENPALSIGTSVGEIRTTSVTNTLDVSASDENDKEVKESENKKTNSKVYSEFEENLTQKIKNVLLDEPAEPVESVETEEVLTADPEDLDPGAVIDWMLRKRSE